MAWLSAMCHIPYLTSSNLAVNLNRAIVSCCCIDEVTIWVLQLAYVSCSMTLGKQIDNICNSVLEPNSYWCQLHLSHWSYWTFTTLWHTLYLVHFSVQETQFERLIYYTNMLKLNVKIMAGTVLYIYISGCECVEYYHSLGVGHS